MEKNQSSPFLWRMFRSLTARRTEATSVVTSGSFSLFSILWALCRQLTSPLSLMLCRWMDHPLQSLPVLGKAPTRHHVSPKKLSLQEIRIQFRKPSSAANSFEWICGGLRDFWCHCGGFESLCEGFVWHCGDFCVFVEVLCVIVEVLSLFVEVLFGIVEVFVYLWRFCLYLWKFSVNLWSFVEFLYVFLVNLCVIVKFLVFLGDFECIYGSFVFICGGFVCVCKKHLTRVHTESNNIRTTDRWNK